LQVSPNIFKILSLVFSGLTGLFAFGIVGAYLLLAEGIYQQQTVREILRAL
jgi:hypothetical protein